jgi:pyridinium-3,5-bisthiocarboxylic acid mononucleotide nickel chelatase
MKAHNDRIVLIDASPAGVSGDKFLGAFVDLGGKPEILRRVAKVVAETLPNARSPEIQIRKVERGEIGAQQIIINSHDDTSKRKGTEILTAAKKSVGKLGLSQWASKFVVSTITSLTDAESQVHAHKANELELHELGSADTLIDVLGVACLAESLGLADAFWWCSPIALGGGTTRFSSRTYANPPPAVAEILRKNRFAVEQGPAQTELTTPTGAAITVNLVQKYSEKHPPLISEKIGYGAGSKEIEEVANVLRLTVGRTSNSSHPHDSVVILETNLDDVSGEVIGYATEKLMAMGARDVTVASVLMKKNRPGHIISVIAPTDKAESLASTLLEETGTLGVREIPVQRHIANRDIRKIDLKLGARTHTLRVKVSRGQGGNIIRAKPEYDDLARIADQTGISLRILARRAETLAEELLSAKKG